MNKACLQYNRDYFAVTLDYKAIAEYMKKQNIDLGAEFKTALETAQKDCISYTIVDALLKLNNVNINKFINILIDTKQEELIKYLTMRHEAPSECLEEYKRVAKCPMPISKDHKDLLVKNKETILKWLTITAEDILPRLVSWKIVSDHDAKILERYINDAKPNYSYAAAELVHKNVINGNAIQYIAFVNIIAKHTNRKLLLPCIVTPSELKFLDLTYNRQ